MFDGEALGLEVVSATKAHVDKAVAPLLKRIAELERREAHYHEMELATTQSLVNIEVGYKSAIAALPAPEPEEFDLESVRAITHEIIDARLAAFPVPENGKDADPEVVRVMVTEAVMALPSPQDGKDADPELVASLVRETVERAVAALPVPRDGQDGAPGQDGAAGADGVNGKDAVLPDLSVLEYAPDEVATSIALAVKKMAEFSGTKIVEVAEKSIPVTLPTFLEPPVG